MNISPNIMKTISLPNNCTRRVAIAGGGAWIIGAAAGCHAAPDRKPKSPEKPGPASKGPPGPVLIPKDALTPEMFGAKGDGATNDSAAFARLAEAITHRGGGTIALRRKTYIVGAQRRDPSGAE